jgi:hypothetical protein
MCVEQLWNDDGEHASDTSSTTNSTWSDLGVEPVYAVEDRRIRTRAMTRPVVVAVHSLLCLRTAIILHFESEAFRPRRISLMILRTNRDGFPVQP